MPLFSAGQVKIESGLSSITMMPIDRATTVGINYNIPRTNVNVLNRSKPLNQRPVVNYTPVDVSVNYYKGDKNVERALGLFNDVTVISGLLETRQGVASTAVRNIQVYYAPTSASNYNGLLNISSGVLTSYSLQGSVGDPVSATVAFQGLDMSGGYVTNARDSTNYSASLIRPDNVSLTGILFSGVGLTGVTIQSFSFGLNINRTQVLELGKTLPVERPLTDVNASLQVQGFFEGINDAVKSLEVHRCGAPMDGNIVLDLTPSCSNLESTKIFVGRPYFDSFNIEGQAGGFSTFSLSLTAPIGANSNEISDGSVVRIT